MENKFPSEIIELPSQGYFYPSDNTLSSGKIEIKYMTAKEEDILMSDNLLQKGTAIDTLLKSLILTPIKYDDLLIGDKNAILLASRILAYGKDYQATVTCQHCREKSDTTIDLTTFDTKEIDLSLFKKGLRTFSLQLPVSKKTVEVKFTTHEDERAIEADVKAMKKIEAQTGVSAEMTTRFRHIIVSVDGDSKKETINNFVNGMLAQDSLHIRSFIKKNMPDVDMTYPFECPACSKVSVTQLPFNANFFWPSDRI